MREGDGWRQGEHGLPRRAHRGGRDPPGHRAGAISDLGAWGPEGVMVLYPWTRTRQGRQHCGCQPDVHWACARLRPKHQRTQPVAKHPAVSAPHTLPHTPCGLVWSFRRSPDSALASVVCGEHGSRSWGHAHRPQADPRGRGPEGVSISSRLEWPVPPRVVCLSLHGGGDGGQPSPVPHRPETEGAPGPSSADTWKVLEKQGEMVALRRITDLAHLLPCNCGGGTSD